MKKPPKYFFNELGLRFSVQFLTLMKNEIRTLTPNEQAEFVDMVTYENVMRGRKVIDHVPDSVLHRNTNVTTIGNHAFVYLYHPNEVQRQLARQILELLKTMIIKP